MADFGDDEWKEMCCVEAGQVGKPIELQANAIWHGRQFIRAAL